MLQRLFDEVRALDPVLANVLFDASLRLGRNVRRNLNLGGVGAVDVG